MTAEAAYAELIRRTKEAAVLGSCGAVLGWDERTYMPQDGSAFRGDQMAPARPADARDVDRPEGRRVPGGSRGHIARRRPGVARGNQRARDSPVLRPRRQAAERTRRGAGPGDDAGPAGVAGGPRQRTTSPRSARGSKRSSRSSGTRPTRSATRNIRTTRCSTSTNPARRPPRFARCSPRCRRSWCR